MDTRYIASFIICTVGVHGFLIQYKKKSIIGLGISFSQVISANDEMTSSWGTWWWHRRSCKTEPAAYFCFDVVFRKWTAEVRSVSVLGAIPASTLKRPTLALTAMFWDKTSDSSAVVIFGLTECPVAHAIASKYSIFVCRFIKPVSLNLHFIFSFLLGGLELLCLVRRSGHILFEQIKW